MKFYMIITIFVLGLTNCTNYQNKMMEWSKNIPPGSSVTEVKNMQPDYITIDWKTPDTTNNHKRYYIIKIKNNFDLLSMEYFLEFNKDGFVSLFCHK